MNVRRICAGTAALVALLFTVTMLPGEAADSARPYTTWRHYAGSADSMQYSALTNINKSNVSTLERVWFHHVPGPLVRLVFNPLVVDGVMFVLGAKRSILALDAATGKELWSRSLDGNTAERGLHYWESQDRSDRRLVFWADSYLQELDARTGEPITSFGAGGRVDLREGLGRPVHTIRNIQSKNPGRIFENLIIVGSVTGEGYGSPPGDIRAYDVRTGKLVWTFRTIPHPGDKGYETWPPDAWKYAGGANAWAGISIDEKRAIAYVPTGSPTHDLYGADRAGDNLFGNCLIALDARTGKRLWHFQTVHHDLWDYDLAASPNLLTVRHNGKMIDVVAQAGKTGFLYVFNRVTGEPVWPIEERPVPKSEVPGEVSSPTQPFPTKPPPFARQSFRPDDVNPFMSAEEQARLRKAVEEAANEGVFTPSSHKRSHIQFPGAWGGANWGSTAADPATGMLFVRSLEMPSYRIMSASDTQTSAVKGGSREQKGFAIYAQLCSTCHGPGQTPMKSPAALGRERFRTLVRQGLEQMPAFSDAIIPTEGLDALEAFLLSLPAAEDSRAADGESDRADGAPLRLPPNPTRYAGPPVRYAGSFSAGWYTSNGLPAVGPPWTQLVAYDLNEGTIKWRVPDGIAPGLAARGIKDTGSVRPRNGPVVTAGGLVFMANSQDRRLRAFDKDTGAILWEHELEANPEGIPAVYEVDGRQFIVFAVGASWGTGTDPVWRDPFHRKQGRIEAQGYHAFALPMPAAGERSPRQ
jgi:quinoprotein glucose dehydrogenase